MMTLLMGSDRVRMALGEEETIRSRRPDATQQWVLWRNGEKKAIDKKKIKSHLENQKSCSGPIRQKWNLLAMAQSITLDKNPTLLISLQTLSSH